MPELEKPPLGVLPFYLWYLMEDADPSIEAYVARHKQVMDAIERRRSKGFPINPKWLCEVGICSDCNGILFQGDR